MSTTTFSKQEKIKYINIVVVLFFMFGFQFIPPFSTLTSTGMHVLGIFIGALYGWSTIDLVFPSIFAIISMSFVEGYSLSAVVAAGFGNTTFWTIFFMLLFVMVFEKLGGTKFVAAWIMTRKFLKGKPTLFNFMLLFATYLIGMLNGFASLLIFFSILFQICYQVGYEKHSKYPTLMLIGIAFAAMFGTISVPLKGVPIMLTDAFKSASGIEISFVEYTKVCWIMGLLLLIVFSLMIKYVFRCDLSPLSKVDTEKLFDQNDLQMTPQLKVMFGLSAVLVLGIAGGAFFPSTSALGGILNSLGLLGISMILLGLMTYLKVNGAYMFEIQQCATSLQWGVLFISAAVLPMSSMLTMEGTGIDTFISVFLGNRLAMLPTSAFIAVALLLTVILTNVGNNAAICILLMPVILNVCSATEIDSAPVFLALIYASHLAMLTPGACPYAAIVWGEIEWISPKEIFRYIPVVMLVFYICILFVGYNWAKFILG